MLDNIINNPNLKKYITLFENGQIIFLEGDDSQDLFILVSGQLDILKGNKKIAEITEPGDMFGEMSFLLGARRTATVKCKSDGEAICIPKEEITSFLGKFPDIAREITRLLARRLDETSQILYGLKEFCDQLPEAVVLTNSEGKILTWNSIAEKMYGRTWDQMRYSTVQEIYEEPREYKNYIEGVQSRYSVREKILKIRHPEKGSRFISTSTTVLYDGHHNFQGLLSLGRDVTKFKKMELSYHSFRKWIILSIVFAFLIAVTAFFISPYFREDSSTINAGEKQWLRNQLGKDFLLLKSLLIKSFAERDRRKTNQLMKDFFDIQEIDGMPYHGLVLLDENLVVFDAYSIKADKTDSVKMVGSSYSGIEFNGNENSLHKVLTLYRADKDHPMGRKGIEIAFEIREEDRRIGWLIFQVDLELLSNKYRLKQEDLKRFRFERS